MCDKTIDFPNTATLLANGKCKAHLIDHHTLFVGVSGGADSDIVVDLLEKVIKENCYENLKIHYVFFDTGIEYDATKRHLDDLEKKYGIEIKRIRANIPVSLGCQKYGVPFLSKHVSEMLERLQKHNFDFANDGNKSFAELLQKYPKCKVALKFWCNENKGKKKSKSSYNINRFLELKDFMIANPPSFKISQKCCNGAKKRNAHDYIVKNDCDLSILGLRKAEDGIRATAIKSCYSQENNGCDIFRPIWWFSDTDRKQYAEYYAIQHSDCYTVYGLKRTGCAGCPFGSRWAEELKVIEEYEPKLYRAVCNIFGESYKYTRKYKEYASRLKQGICDGQLSIFDLIGEPQ